MSIPQLVVGGHWRLMAVAGKMTARFQIMQVAGQWSYKKDYFAS